MKNIMKFEDYLKDIHAEDDYMGTDDNMPDDFENWLSNLDVDEIIQYADNYIKKMMKDVKIVIDKNYQDIMEILK